MSDFYINENVKLKRKYYLALKKQKHIVVKLMTMSPWFITSSCNYPIYIGLLNCIYLYYNTF